MSLISNLFSVSYKISEAEGLDIFWGDGAVGRTAGPWTASPLRFGRSAEEEPTGYFAAPLYGAEWRCCRLVIHSPQEWA